MSIYCSSDPTTYSSAPGLPSASNCHNAASGLTDIFPPFPKTTPSRTSIRSFSFCKGPIPPPRNGICQFRIFPPSPSKSSSLSSGAGADDAAHSPLNPPTKKLDAITRWHGMRGAKGLLRSAPPTERGEPWPRLAQTSLYVDTLPAGIVRTKSYTAQWCGGTRFPAAVRNASRSKRVKG